LSRARPDRPAVTRASGDSAKLTRVPDFMEEAMSKAHHEHHASAAEHHEHAAHHHREAARHYESGDHEKAGHHAHVAHGHGVHATHHAHEAAKHHAEHHGEGDDEA
jgi:hypothetical protein